jgi:hypothetical protein
MKYRFLFFPLFVLSILFITCRKDTPVIPTACFALSNNDVDTGQVVTMNATCSDQAERYEWDFGDNTTATGASVSHEWQSYGNKMVALTVYSSDNSTSTVGKGVNVDPRYRFAGTYNVTQSCGSWINPYTMTVSLNVAGGIVISNFNGINWDLYSSDPIFSNTNSINISTDGLVDSNSKHWDISGLATISGNTLTFSYFADNQAYYVAEGVAHNQYSCNAIAVKQ